METFQRSEPVLEIGDSEALYEAFMVEQLQAEVVQLHAMLEDERRHGRELEDQIKASNGHTSLDSAYKLPNIDSPELDISTENPCYAKEKRKIKHQEAILQLQMELASIDPPGASDATKGHRWEEDPVAINMEAFKAVLAEEHQNYTLEAKASTDHLRQQLKDLTQSAETKDLNVVDSSAGANESDLKCFSKLQREWEGAALRMLDQLSLLAVGSESEQDGDKHNTTAFSLKERLLQAHMLAVSADKRLQDVSDLMLNSIASWADTCNNMEAVLQLYQSLKTTKKNLEACNVNLGEAGQRSAVASTLVWWMSETATVCHEASRVTWDGKRRQLESEKELLELRVQSNISLLENILSELSSTEAQVQEVVDKVKGEPMRKKLTAIAREQALVAAAVAEAEQRCVVAEAARLKLEEELRQHLEATNDLQHQVNALNHYHFF